MSHYLLKYKGTYRVLPELDNETMDIPRDLNGEVADGYDDLYIKCSFGNKIFAYGSEEGKKTVYLMAYIPSIGRGRNISKALTKQGVEFIDYSENDEEDIYIHDAVPAGGPGAVLQPRPWQLRLCRAVERTLGRTQCISHRW